MTNLTQKVLAFIEPDSSKWKDWLEHKDLYPVSQSEGILEFMECMHEAKANSFKVLVAGDYDCDGIMATTIMVDGLRKYGLEVGFYIPNRIKEGYGLNVNTVELAYKKGYKIIITVDNGVKAFDALERASQLGIQTIVTDHHTMDEFVDCDCLVHPEEMEDCFSTLCGAGVAYECMRALHISNDFHLMCACVASIGDVMKVIGQTRVIIQKGIEKLNQTQEPHFMSLANDKVVNETSIGFQIVPKLNALGRLSNLANVNNAVRYFLSESSIQQFALQIDSINTQRKNMSMTMVEDVLKYCDVREHIFYVSDDHYHEGLIGLAAGAICSQYDKPTIIATSRDGITKCSMRSPEGFNCMDFLHDFEFFETFGGHAQASGFSFNDEYEQDFVDYIHERIYSYEWQKEKKECLMVVSQELSLNEVRSLDVLRPFGPGFEMPTLELIHPNIKNIFDIQSGKHRKYIVDNGLQCMNFNQSQKDLQSKNKEVSSFEGTVNLNYYQQRYSVNFMIDKINYEN